MNPLSGRFQDKWQAHVPVSIYYACLNPSLGIVEDQQKRI